MGTVIREIDGIKGFCMYKNGQPYTYIYTRDAIEMLGLVEFRNNKYTLLRINTFGNHYMNILNELDRIKVDPTEIGITLSPNFRISSINSAYATGCVSQLRTKSSNYDDILPEFILDRIIFAIANRLNNETAKEFRLQLFCTVIPHFQQTATQDQIAQVPILNQTTQFMYDNTNHTFIVNQSYDFYKNILIMHIDRYARLTNQMATEELFESLWKEFEDILNVNGVSLLKEVEKVVETRLDIEPNSPKQILDCDIKDTLICNRRMYSLFISFMTYKIRDEEAYLLREENGEYLDDVEDPYECGETMKQVKSKPGYGKQVVRHESLDDRSGNPYYMLSNPFQSDFFD